MEMSINVDAFGNSVYINHEDYEARADAPLYEAARTLAVDLTQTGTVLDLGCSNGVASYGLAADHRVIGLDMAASALKNYADHSDRALLVQADVTQLPFRQSRPETADLPDVAMMLDVLEHVSWSEAVTVLQGLKQTLAPKHHLIVSMPIISSLSLNTWAERLAMVPNGGRPATGLYDRTHQILTNDSGHKRLFRAGGYRVVSESRTLADGSVTDLEAETSGAADGSAPEPSEGMTLSLSNLARAVRYPRQSLCRVERTLRPSSRLQQIARRLLEYQGLYVLQPGVAETVD